MSTATSALQSYESVAYPEPVVRRRRGARPRRPFALVRGAGSPVRPAVPAPRPPAPRPEFSRGPAAEVFAAYGASGPAAARKVLAAAATRPADAELDHAFATVPQTDSPRPRRAAVRSDRGPRAVGSRGAVLYASVSGVGRARGAHPVRRVEQAQWGFAALAVTALLTALVVVGLLGLAHMRSGGFADRVEPVVPGISAPVEGAATELSGTVR
ncbi:hypothetical protein [Nocardia asteroides]|uniref:hypothetical protein n=1 Tax=Nocardia asteroides TaxID=1824 RepID=UPI003668CD82